MRVVDAIAEIIKQEGVQFLSCYPTTPIIDACAAVGIRPYLCRQERVGAGIADGFSRVTNGQPIGVFAMQYGPGAENAFPGVATAFSDSTPILCLPLGHPRSRAQVFPMFSSARSFADVTKSVETLNLAGEVEAVMRRAFNLLKMGRPGPVMVEIPADVALEEVPQTSVEYVPVKATRSAGNDQDIAAAAMVLLGSQHPIVHAGQGVLYAEAGERMAALAEMIPAAVVTTNPGKSAIPDSHPLSLGASTRSRSKMFADFMARADLIVAIGSSLTRTPFGPGVPPGKKIIHSTNEASDINKEYRVDHAVIGDAGLVLDALIAEVGRQKGRGGGNALASLKEEIAAGKKAWLAEWSKHLDSDETPINQYRVIRDLMRTVDRDNVIMTHDSGSPREQMIPFWESTAPGSYMGWGKSTQLGYGLGITMGAKLAAPDKLCVNIMGDAAIGMTGMDIETAARNRIAILTVVFNNGVMAAERDVLKLSTKKYGALTVGGNYAKVAEGLNVASWPVEKPADIVPAIKEAVGVTQSGAPFLLEIVVKEGYDFSRYN
jgi:acetolactate synthase-1/2/3 large subunit